MVCEGIPAWEAGEIGEDAARFHQDFARTPLLVRNLYPADSALRRLDLNAIERMLGDRSIPVYNSESPGYRDAPAAEVLDGLRRGRGSHNIVDYYIAGTPIGGPVPSARFSR